MTRSAHPISICLLALIISAAHAQAPAAPSPQRPSLQRPERFPITTLTIASALATPEAPVSPTQIALPTEITAADPSPALQLTSIERSGDRAARLRLACTVQKQCLPFFATLTWPDTASATTATAALRSQTRFQPSGQPPSEPAAIRSGAHATLIIDSNRIHIRVPVVCLENGAVGHTVRVAGLDDRKQIYRAEVLDADSLKGSL